MSQYLWRTDRIRHTNNNERVCYFYEKESVYIFWTWWYPTTTIRAANRAAEATTALASFCAQVFACPSSTHHLGSGQRYLICITHFVALCVSRKIHGHAACAAVREWHNIIAISVPFSHGTRESHAISVPFSHGSGFFDSLNHLSDFFFFIKTNGLESVDYHTVVICPYFQYAENQCSCTKMVEIITRTFQ